MLKTIGRLLTGLNWLNWLVGGLLIVMLAVTFLLEGRLMLGLSHRYGADNAARLVPVFRMLLALTLPMMVAAHIVFTRLRAIVASVASHDGLSRANANRLRQIAWALLATQLLDLIYGIFAPGLSATTGEYFGWSPGLTGWLAVLLLFVLARVFHEGAGMREELDATV